MIRIEKRPYEEFFRFHEFRRADGRGWLNSSETLSSCGVTITEKATGADVSAAMVANVAVYSSTQVRYQLLGGSPNALYTVAIQVVTTNEQRFEDKIELKVV